MFVFDVILAVLVFVLFSRTARLRHLDNRVSDLERELYSRRTPAPEPQIAPSPVATADAPAPEVAMAEDIPSPHILKIPAREELPPRKRKAVPESIAPEPETIAATPSRSFGFEDLFGRRLPIWAGGVTLAIAGFLIVKYSIDIGLLSPLVRVINGLLFGFGLIGAAEVARRKESWMRDERVRQALSGAGLATLYGSVLVAANVYDLIGPAPALAGMAAVTALAMFLAMRFGAPSALLGLLGGLAAPALVGAGPPNIPLLSTYLALAVGGLCALSRSQRWAWLGVSALAGGFLWGGALIVGGRLDDAATLSVGAYLLLLGILLPLTAFAGAGQSRLRIAGSLVAAAQMAALVASGGFTMLHWGLFGLISIAIVWLSRREEALNFLAPIGLVIATLLLAAWPNPRVLELGVALGGTALIYGPPAWRDLWAPRGGLSQAGQLAVIGLVAFVVPLAHFYAAHLDHLFAMLALGAALLPGAAAAASIDQPERQGDTRFAMLVSASAILLAFAAGLAVPSWAVAPAVGAVGALLLLVSLWADDRKIEFSAWCLATAGLAFFLVDFGSQQDFARAFGLEGEIDVGRATTRWGLAAGVGLLFAWRARSLSGRAVAQALAALLAYGTAAQLVPPEFIPSAVALTLVGLAWASRRLAPGALSPAMGALLGVTAAWSLAPLAHWLANALPSLGGVPLFVHLLPGAQPAILRLQLPAFLVLAALWQTRGRIDARTWRLAACIPAILGIVALHIVYKQAFAIGSVDEFVLLGLAERSLWEALLLAAAAIAWSAAGQVPSLRRAASVLCATALAHSLWYTILLHNPLWAEQSVGSTPLLLLLAYTLPLAAIWLVRRHEPDFAQSANRAFAVLQMILVLFFAFSLLRQLFHGPILVTPGVSDAEDIMRSVVAIGLAIAFLLAGIARSSRDWRIGSLVLMLAAVAKVFLFDASGLEGLARILSFVALGFSLIGIGWLYSRYLNDDRINRTVTAAG